MCRVYFTPLKTPDVCKLTVEFSGHSDFVKIGILTRGEKTNNIVSYDCKCASKKKVVSYDYCYVNVLLKLYYANFLTFGSSERQMMDIPQMNATLGSVD